MKKHYISALLLYFATASYSQTYEFQNLIDIESAAVVNQGKTGTCWSFSTSSFLESEITRKTGKYIDLSEMYSVRQVYPLKAENFIMRQGKAQFGQGGLAHDVINSMRQFGLMPQAVYSGLEGLESYNHDELFAALQSLVQTFAQSKTPISNKWRNIVSAVLDEYMGKIPESFTFEKKTYTAQSFLKMTGLNPDDYVSITSFENQKQYDSFVLNIPDNFSNGSLYNLPLEAYLKNIDYALDHGFTLSLDCDVSEPTFSSTYGIAVIPENKADHTLALTEIKPEKHIDAAYRLQEFENFNTQDDHLMQIVGKLKDQKGTIYYKVKNSWGGNSERVGNQGYIYMSAAYLKLKSISVLVHKDGLTPDTRSRLRLKT